MPKCSRQITVACASLLLGVLPDGGFQTAGADHQRVSGCPIGRDGGKHALVRTLKLPSSPNAIAVDTQTGRVFVADQANSVYVLDASSGSLHRIVSLQGIAQAVAVDGRTNRVFISDYGNSRMHILRGTDGTLLRTVRVAPDPGAIAVAQTTAHVFVTHYTSGRVSMLDAASGSLLRTIVLGAHPEAVVVDEQSSRVFVAVNRGLAVLDAATGVRLRTLDLGMSVGQIVVDQASGDVVAGGTSGDLSAPFDTTRIAVLDGAGRRVLRTIRVGQHALGSLVDAQNGILFVARVNTNAVDVVDMRTGTVRRTVGLPEHVGDMAVDVRDERVFVPSFGRSAVAGIVTVLDAATGAPLGVVSLVGVYPMAALVDEQTQRVFVTNMGDGTPRNTGSVSVLNAACW